MPEIAEAEEDMFEVGEVAVVTPPPPAALAGERLVPVTGDPDDEAGPPPAKPNWSCTSLTLNVFERLTCPVKHIPANTI